MITNTQEKHGIDKIFEDVLQRLLMTKPKDHMQYIIDLMTFSNPDDATQVDLPPPPPPPLSIDREVEPLQTGLLLVSDSESHRPA